MPSKISTTLNEFISLGNSWSAVELNAAPGLIPFLAVQLSPNHGGFDLTAIEWGIHMTNAGDNDAFLPYCIGLLNCRLETETSIPSQIETILALPPVLRSKYPRFYLDLGDMPATPPVGAQAAVFRSKDRPFRAIKIPPGVDCAIAISVFVYNGPMLGALIPYMIVRGEMAPTLPAEQEVGL